MQIYENHTNKPYSCLGNDPTPPSNDPLKF